MHSRDGAPTRRQFLSAAAAAGAAGAFLAACSDDGDEQGGADGTPIPPHPLPFAGEHQAAITSRAPAAGIVAAFDSQASDRAELTEAFRALSDEVRRTMDGAPVDERPGGFPPFDSGVLDARAGGNEVGVIVGVGASLFDDRYGLGARRPRELVPMPAFANDSLVTDGLSHGDVSITVSAASHDAAAYTFRQLMRRTRGALTLRWMQEGFNTLLPVEAGEAPVRNLMGFRDGTANLDTADRASMDELIWVSSRAGEPEWAVGGTYQAIRVIRMLVEFWDRTRLSEQEGIIGRHKVSGAPLGLERETDIPVFGDGAIPVDAHIRLANPRTASTDANRILRRGFSYSRGFDDVGQLDQGLLFQSFQASLDDGFVAVQQRLDGEPLEEYIRPVGGGFFFALPGVTTPGGYLGQSLLV